MQSTHPLRPPPLTFGMAIAGMCAAAHVCKSLGKPWKWYVVQDGERFEFCAEADLVFYPNAPIVARTHCDGCGDPLANPAALVCPACSEWQGSEAPRAADRRAA